MKQNAQMVWLTDKLFVGEMETALRVWGNLEPILLLSPQGNLIFFVEEVPEVLIRFAVLHVMFVVDICM